MRYLLPVILLFCLNISVFAHEANGQNRPDTVKAGAYVISVHDINFHEKEYTILFWLWFLCDNADFDLTTQLDIPNAKTIDKPEVIVDSMEGKAWVIMKMKCIMKESWDVEDFPFDEQHLTVQIENTLFDKNSLVFLPDTAGSRFDHKEAIDGWTIKNFRVRNLDNDYETGFGDSRPGREEATFFTIHHRNGNRARCLGLVSEDLHWHVHCISHLDPQLHATSVRARTKIRFARGWFVCCGR